MLGLLCADDLVFCGESEENLRALVGHFAEVCRRRGLKVNASSHSVGRLWKRWTDTVKECLKKERFGCQANKENGAG